MEDMEMEVEGMRNDLQQLYLTKNQVEEMIASKLQDFKDSKLGDARGNLQNTKNTEDRSKQVVALGFKESLPSGELEN
eukprot:1359485-Pyramimonas_sp.AAC.1